jgi:hypothetical protein
MGAVNIHQIQVRYDALADRLLLQVRTQQGQVYAGWLTRRLALRLHVPLQRAVARHSVVQVSPHALPVPEARAMLEQAALQRPLPGAQFDKPFEAEGSAYPLGRDPLLPAAAQLTPRSDGGLSLVLQEDRGRRMELVLAADLASALLRLMDAAIKASEWTLPGVPDASTSGEPMESTVLPEVQGRLLN